MKKIYILIICVVFFTCPLFAQDQWIDGLPRLLRGKYSSVLDMNTDGSISVNTSNPSAWTVQKKAIECIQKSSEFAINGEYTIISMNAVDVYEQGSNKWLLKVLTENIGNTFPHNMYTYFTVWYSNNNDNAALIQTILGNDWAAQTIAELRSAIGNKSYLIVVSNSISDEHWLQDQSTIFRSKEDIADLKNNPAFRPRSKSQVAVAVHDN